MCQLDELPCNARFLHALGCIGDVFAVHHQIVICVGIHGPQANMMWSSFDGRFKFVRLGNDTGIDPDRSGFLAIGKVSK
jgi:hypothetical protein